VEFVFGEHRLDADRRELRQGGARIALEPQVFDVLLYLVRNRDRVVTKDDLLAAVTRWRRRSWRLGRAPLDRRGKIRVPG